MFNTRAWIRITTEGEEKKDLPRRQAFDTCFQMYFPIQNSQSFGWDAIQSLSQLLYRGLQLHIAQLQDSVVYMAQ
jgi:hypothetical protein